MFVFTLRLVCKLIILIPIVLPVLLTTGILSLAIGDDGFKHWLKFNEVLIAALPFSEFWNKQN